MDKEPDYRKRRVAVVIAGLALLAVANRDRPMIGSLSVDFDTGRLPRVEAKLAPPLDAVAAAAAVFAAERLSR